MQSTTRKIFDSLVQEIKTAVARHAFYSVCHRAKSLGLTGTRIDLKFSVRYHFEHMDANGATITLQAYSYDPSGPLETRAGITRFTVALAEDGLVGMQYEGEYAGLIQTQCAEDAMTS